MVKNGLVPVGKPETSRLSYLNLLFSIAFFIFIIGPPFLGYRFAPYPLMHIADIFDLFTPLVILPLYWLIFRYSAAHLPGLKVNLIFMILAAFWVLGQGMHLSANSIDNLLKLKGLESGDVYNLTFFYDETLGHYLWHFGTIGLSALFIFREWRNPLTGFQTGTGRNITAGICYGFVFFAMVVEGNTVPMGLPFTVLAIVFILIWNRAKLNQKPLSVLFLTGYLFAMSLFVIWGVWQKGFPGFFEAGILPG
jgi:hypothetical protein